MKPEGGIPMYQMTDYEKTCNQALNVAENGALQYITDALDTFKTKLLPALVHGLPRFNIIIDQTAYNAVTVSWCYGNQGSELTFTHCSCSTADEYLSGVIAYLYSLLVIIVRGKGA
jgi:hypothetical protein